MSINTEMTALADAIRNKSGVTGKLSIAAMTSTVENIVINPGGGETVDLSFVTATAGDILSGKVGADKNGNPVHGTLELTGGSDIDLSGVTVTADKMLAGIVAVGADGNKVTGNIQTVAASSDGEYVTIPAGFHPTEQKIPVTISGDGGYDTSIVTATADTMLEGVIAVGANGEVITGNIPESTVTETDTSITITPGYLNKQLQYDLNSGNSGEDVIYGVINENGQFQPLDLSGEHPVETGNPEVVSMKIFDTGKGEPAYLPSGVGGTLDLVKIVSYVPAKPAWTEPEKIIIASDDYEQQYGPGGQIQEDILDANGNPITVHFDNRTPGVYEVTPETANTMVESFKIFQHTKFPDTSIRHLESYRLHGFPVGWAIVSANNSMLQAGFEYGWLLCCCMEGEKNSEPEYIPLSEDMPWTMVSQTDGSFVDASGMPLEHVAPVVHEATPMTIVAERVTGFVNGRWQTSGEKIEITEFTEEPFEGGVYTFDGSKLGASVVSGYRTYVVDSVIPEIPKMSHPVNFVLDGLYSLTSEDGYDYSIFNGTYGAVYTAGDQFKTIYKHMNRDLYAWYAENDGASDSSIMFFGPSKDDAKLEMSFEAPYIDELRYSSLPVVIGGVYEIYECETGNSASVVINDVNWYIKPASTGSFNVQNVIKNTTTGEWDLQMLDYGIPETRVGYDELPVQNGIYAIDGDRFIGGLLGTRFPNAKQVSEQSVLHLDFSRAEPLKDMSDKNHEVTPSDDIFRGTSYGWDMSGRYCLSARAISQDLLFGEDNFTWYALFYPTSDSEEQHIMGYSANNGMKLGFGSRYLNVDTSQLKGNKTVKMSDELELNKWHSVYIIRDGALLYSLVDIDFEEKFEDGNLRVIRDGEKLKLFGNELPGTSNFYHPTVGYCHVIDIAGKPEEDAEGFQIGKDFASDRAWQGKLNIIDIASGANPPVDIQLTEEV